MGHGLSAQHARVVAVIQARMSSTRLPGKALALLGGHTALELLLLRLSSAEELDDTVIATSTDVSDDAIAREGRRLGIPVVRGPLDDVLARYIDASETRGADAVVRITGDCPLIDAEIVDQVVRQWRRSRVDYVTNTLHPRSYPDGLDVEVLSTAALHRVSAAANRPSDREHVTTYIRDHPEHFRVAELRLVPSLGTVRITLDTQEDLRTLTHLVSTLGPSASMTQIVEALGVHGPFSVRTTA